MKRFAQFHPFSGISGDMALAALIDAGASLEYIVEGISRLDLVPEGTSIVRSTVVRHAVTATKVDVVDGDGVQIDRMMDQVGRSPAASVAHGHSHGEQGGRGGHHHHHHDHHHDDSGHGDHGDPGGGDYVDHHHHVTYRDIAEAIRKSQLPERVRTRSVDIFRAIAIGEARVHGVSVDDVHFHEVGAVDSIVDIVGVALALESLDIDVVYSTEVSLGSGGMIRSQHGMIPIPAPATLEILRGFPVTSTEIPSELTTPTGAGVVAGLSSGTAPEGTYSIDGTGFGGGTKELEARPNLLRVVVGTLGVSGTGESAQAEEDRVILLEANVDDLSPEAWPRAFDRLFDAGALDVWLTTTIMKKGRPGILLSVLVAPEYVESVEREVFQTTSTIGLRKSQRLRSKLVREVALFDTPMGQFRAKIIVTGAGEEIRPEADEINRYAEANDLSFAEADRAIRNAIEVSRSRRG